MRLSKATVVALAVIVGPDSLSAPSSFNAVGPLYEIQEQDLQTYIELSINKSKRDGSLDKKIAMAQKRAKAYVLQPDAVTGLSAANASTSRLFDPSIALAKAVISADGSLLHAAGTKINPLKKAALKGRLIFFDARDEAQLHAVQKYLNDDVFTRVILVGGSPAKFHELTGLRTYFDQGGVIVKRLQINEVPAIVSQQGLSLKINTLAATVSSDK